LLEKKNIFFYFGKYKKNLISDITTLIIFLGNDFLPKIQSLYSKNSIQIIGGTRDFSLRSVRFEPNQGKSGSELEWDYRNWR
jgi:5'-3' exonuclease